MTCPTQQRPGWPPPTYQRPATAAQWRVVQAQVETLGSHAMATWSGAGLLGILTVLAPVIADARHAAPVLCGSLVAVPFPLILGLIVHGLRHHRRALALRHAYQPATARLQPEGVPVLHGDASVPTPAGILPQASSALFVHAPAGGSAAVGTLRQQC